MLPCEKRKYCTLMWKNTCFVFSQNPMERRQLLAQRHSRCFAWRKSLVRSHVVQIAGVEKSLESSDPSLQSVQTTLSYSVVRPKTTAKAILGLPPLCALKEKHSPCCVLPNTCNCGISPFIYNSECGKMCTQFCECEKCAPNG